MHSKNCNRRFRSKHAAHRCSICHKVGHNKATCPKIDCQRAPQRIYEFTSPNLGKINLALTDKQYQYIVTTTAKDFVDDVNKTNVDEQSTLENACCKDGDDEDFEYEEDEEEDWEYEWEYEDEEV